MWCCVFTSCSSATSRQTTWFSGEAQSSFIERLSWCVTVVGTAVSQRWDKWFDWLRAYLFIATPSDLDSPSLSLFELCAAAHTWAKIAGALRDAHTDLSIRLVHPLRCQRTPELFAGWSKSQKETLLHPAIVTLRNQQAHINTHFTPRLASCAELRKEPGFQQLFFFFLILYTVLFLSALMWATECNAVNVFQERLSENVRHYLHKQNHVSPSVWRAVFHAAFKCGRSEHP